MGRFLTFCFLLGTPLALIALNASGGPAMKLSSSAFQLARLKAALEGKDLATATITGYFGR